MVRVLSWTHNLLIMSRSKRDEEREFYLRLCVQEWWSKRKLERQPAGALFERVAFSPAKLSPPVRELHPEAASVFKDSYLVDRPWQSTPTESASIINHLRLIWLALPLAFVTYS